MRKKNVDAVAVTPTFLGDGTDAFGGGLVVTVITGCQFLRLSRPAEVETFAHENHAGPESLGKAIKDKWSHGCHWFPDRQLFDWGDKGERLQSKVADDSEPKRETEIDIDRTKPLAGFAFESFVTRCAAVVHGCKRLKKSPMAATRTA